VTNKPDDTKAFLCCLKCNSEVTVHRILNPGGEMFYLRCSGCDTIPIRYGMSPAEAIRLGYWPKDETLVNPLFVETEGKPK